MSLIASGAYSAKSHFGVYQQYNSNVYHDIDKRAPFRSRIYRKYPS